ncbi:MAG: IS4 family transposase, partial [Pseudomonadota bacterium]
QPGQTGVTDRGYQCHRDFDLLQTEGKHFICRIKKKTHQSIIKQQEAPQDSIVFYDARVLLGTAGENQTKHEVRVVAYRVAGVEYFIATDRFDLSAEDIALAYKLRWEIEKFFAWWKRHLKVYHLIARSAYGLMVQLLAGLITYLLLSIYCQEQYNEKVSIKRVREIRIKIRNEFAQQEDIPVNKKKFSKSKHWVSFHAKI